jgi:hypothetical protein
LHIYTNAIELTFSPPERCLYDAVWHIDTPESITDVIVSGRVGAAEFRQLGLRQAGPDRPAERWASDTNVRRDLCGDQSSHGHQP